MLLLPFGPGLTAVRGVNPQCYSKQTKLSNDGQSSWFYSQRTVWQGFCWDIV